MTLGKTEKTEYTVKAILWKFYDYKPTNPKIVLFRMYSNSKDRTKSQHH